MVRHGDLLLRPIPEPKKVLAAAEVAAFTLATSEATHTLTGRIEPAGSVNRVHRPSTGESPDDEGAYGQPARRARVE